MKKFLSVVLSLIAVVSVFAFSACDQTDGKQGAEAALLSEPDGNADTSGAMTDSRVQALLTEMERLQNRVAELENKPEVDISGYTTEIESLQARIAELEAKPEVDISGYTTEIESLQARIAELEAKPEVDISGYTTEIESLQARIAELEAKPEVDISGYVAEIERLRARESELEYYVKRLTSESFRCEGTLYYNAQKWASEEFLQANMTDGLLDPTSGIQYPDTVTHVMTDETEFKAAFPDFPEEVDFVNETVFIYCFTADYGNPFELAQISINGGQVDISVNKLDCDDIMFTQPPAQHVFAIKLNKAMFDGFNLIFDVRTAKSSEISKLLKNSLSKSVLKIEEKPEIDFSVYIDEIEQLHEKISVLEEKVRHLESEDYTGEATLYYSAQKWASEEFLQANKTHQLYTPSTSDNYPDSITHIITDKEQFDAAFPTFPEEVDFDREMIVVHFYSDSSVSPYKLSRIEILGDDLYAEVNKYKISEPVGDFVPCQRVFVFRLSKMTVEVFNVVFGERYYVDREEFLEEVADELSKSELPAQDDTQPGESGQDSSSTDGSAYTAEIENLQARIAELEANVGYLEKAGFNGAGTLYYNAQDFASNAFCHSHRTRGLDGNSIYATTYPSVYKYRITDEAQFKEDFPNFPEEVDFDKEAVVVYCFTDKHFPAVYELSQISVDGEITHIDINRVTAKNYVDTSGKRQRIFLIRMSNVLDYDINITFGVRYTDYEEVAKMAADEYSKSELKENSAWQNRIDQLRKTVERLEVENELLQVELDAYRYHLRSSDYRGTRAQWMDDVVSGRIDVSGNPYLEEKEYWDEATAPPGSTSKGSVLVIIDKNFAEKEFTVDDFKQYFTVYDVSDMSYIEKGEDGKDRFVRQCVLMIGVPFGIVPDVEEYSWNQWDSSTLFEAIRILKDLPFIKYVGPSPFGMGG